MKEASAILIDTTIADVFIYREKDAPPTAPPPTYPPIRTPCLSFVEFVCRLFLSSSASDLIPDVVNITLIIIIIIIIVCRVSWPAPPSPYNSRSNPVIFICTPNDCRRLLYLASSLKRTEIQRPLHEKKR